MSRIRPWFLCLAVILTCYLATSNEAFSQPPIPQPGYGSVEAGLEAYAEAEAQRRAAFAGQVAAQQGATWVAPWPPMPPMPPFIPAPAMMYVPGAYLPRRAVWAYRGAIPVPVPIPYQFQYAGPPGYAPSWSTLGRSGLSGYPYPNGVEQPGAPSQFVPQAAPESPSGTIVEPGPQLSPPTNGQQPGMRSILEPPASSMPSLAPPGGRATPEIIPAPPAENSPK